MAGDLNDVTFGDEAWAISLSRSYLSIAFTVHWTINMAPKEGLGIPDPPLAIPALDNRGLCFSHAMARGEMGVLTFEPYRSLILPFWATQNRVYCSEIRRGALGDFISYCERGDFVVNSDPNPNPQQLRKRLTDGKGADMTRKFINMGLPRSNSMRITKVCFVPEVRFPYVAKHSPLGKRGRKYGPGGKVLEKWSRTDIDGKKCEKDEASDVFKEYWRGDASSMRRILALKEQWKKAKMEYQKTGSGAQEATI